MDTRKERSNVQSDLPPIVYSNNDDISLNKGMIIMMIPSSVLEDRFL